MTAILKVDTIQDTAGNNIINESSDTITIGASGDTTNIVGTLQNNGSAVASTNGITMADQWRLTTTTNDGTSADITSNWERVDTAGAGFIGSAMAESSGVFTFPSTGVYLVHFTGTMYTGTNATGSVKLGLEIHVTTNNSSYTNIASGYGWNPSNQFTYFQSDVSSLIDVTDTSNVKVKFKNINGGSNNSDRVWTGHTSENKTFATFLKVGAT